MPLSALDFAGRRHGKVGRERGKALCLLFTCKLEEEQDKKGGKTGERKAELDRLLVQGAARLAEKKKKEGEREQENSPRAICSCEFQCRKEEGKGHSNGSLHDGKKEKRREGRGRCWP